MLAITSPIMEGITISKVCLPWENPTHVYILLQHQGFVENLTMEHIMACCVAYWMELCNRNKIKLGILMSRWNTSSSASLSIGLVEELHHISSNYLFNPRLHMYVIVLWTTLAINPCIFSTIRFCSSSSKPSRPNKSSRACKTSSTFFAYLGTREFCSLLHPTHQWLTS